MSTATTTTRTDAAAELDRLEAEAHEARQERDRVQREAHAHATRLAGIETEIGRLAQTDRSQFEGGIPKRATEAGKLYAELQKAREGSRWPDLVAGAEHAVAAAEADVAGFRADHAVELATREYRRGEELLATLSIDAERMLATLREIQGGEGRLVGITANCRGRIDGRDVDVDPRLADLRRLLGEHPTFRPPRSRTLTPFPDEHPAVVRGREGGWVSAGHGSDSIADDQPPRVEPAR